MDCFAALRVPRNDASGSTENHHALLRAQLSPTLPQRAQPQRVEPNETFGVALVVGDLAFLERHQILVVQRISALAADNADAALVELEPHAARHEFLAPVD